MKTLIAVCLAELIFIWLAGAFIQLQLNPLMWHSAAREIGTVLYAILLMMAFILYRFSEPPKEK